MEIEVIVTGSFGDEFSIGGVVPGKISLKLGNGLTKDTAGNIVFDPSSFNVAQLVKDNETTTTLDFDSTTTRLTYINEEGATQAIDLSALTTDLFLQGGQFDAASSTLTLKNVDTTKPDIVIPLAALKAVESLSTDTIALSGTGEAGTPLKADAKIDPAITNLLKASAAGLLVDRNDVAPPLDVTVTDPFGNVLFSAGSASV